MKTQYKEIVPKAHLYLPDGTDYWLPTIPDKEFLENTVVNFSAIPNIPKASKQLLSENVYRACYPVKRVIAVKGDFLIEYGSPARPLLVKIDPSEYTESVE